MTTPDTERTANNIYLYVIARYTSSILSSSVLPPSFWQHSISPLASLCAAVVGTLKRTVQAVLDFLAPALSSPPSQSALKSIKATLVLTAPV